MVAQVGLDSVISFGDVQTLLYWKQAVRMSLCVPYTFKREHVIRLSFRCQSPNGIQDKTLSLTQGGSIINGLFI